MSSPLLRLLLAVALPLIVFLGGTHLLSAVSGRATWRKRAPPEPDRKPLHLRFCGYDAAAAARHWAAIGEPGLEAERRFLRWDLLFPLLYGAALATGIVLAWTLAKPRAPAWMMHSVVLIGMLADWIENLVLLGQVRQFRAGGEAPLQSQWIRVASGATFCKFLFLAAAVLLIWGMALFVLGRWAIARQV